MERKRDETGRRAAKQRVDEIKLTLEYSSVCDELGISNEFDLAHLVAERTLFTPRDFLDAGKHDRIFMLHRAMLEPVAKQPVAATGSPVEATPPLIPPSGAELKGEAKALAILVDHPDWKDQQIADAVPCHRSTLYRWPRFKAARKATSGTLPSGAKSIDGNLEAWNDD